jgi:hypothetical protein
MKLGSADAGVDRLEFVGRGVLLEEPVFECRAVALFGVLVGVSYCWFEARVLLERSGVALSVSSRTISLSEMSKSRSLSLAVCIDTSSSEVYPPSPQLLPMLPCSRCERALMTDTRQ